MKTTGVDEETPPLLDSCSTTPLSERCRCTAPIFDFSFSSAQSSKLFLDKRAADRRAEMDVEVAASAKATKASFVNDSS